MIQIIRKYFDFKFVRNAIPLKYGMFLKNMKTFKKSILNSISLQIYFE